MNQVLKTLITGEEMLNVINILKKTIIFIWLVVSIFGFRDMGCYFLGVEYLSFLGKNAWMMMLEAEDDSFVHISSI